MQTVLVLILIWLTFSVLDLKKQVKSQDKHIHSLKEAFDEMMAELIHLRQKKSSKSLDSVDNSLDGVDSLDSFLDNIDIDNLNKIDRDNLDIDNNIILTKPPTQKSDATQSLSKPLLTAENTHKPSIDSFNTNSLDTQINTVTETVNTSQQTQNNSIQNQSAQQPIQNQSEQQKPIRQTSQNLSNQNQPLPLEPDESTVNVVTSLFLSAKNWFMGGNMIVRVGVLVLLVGVVLLLRLASDYFDTPIELRLGLVAIGGAILTGIGLKLVKKRKAYGISLQGTGLAIIYLTLFASFKVFAVLPNLLTFGLLALLSVVSAGLAVKQNAFPLALLAFGGAFIAPLITSDGSNNVVGLFSYYLVINLAVATIAHVRTWKVLNLLGMTVTFALAFIWGHDAFSQENSANLLDHVRWQLLVLVAIHIVLYIFITLRYAQQLVSIKTHKQTNPKNKPTDFALQLNDIIPVDNSLLFGVPLLGFGLLSGLLYHQPYVLAGASAVMSMIYLGLSWFLLQKSPLYNLMTEGTLALGLGFFALMVPIAMGAEWTSMSWALQGLGFIWFGKRTTRFWTVWLGTGLSVVSFLIWLDTDKADVLAIFVIAICCLFSAFLLRLPQAYLDFNKDPNQKKKVTVPLAGLAFPSALFASITLFVALLNLAMKLSNQGVIQSDSLLFVCVMASLVSIYYAINKAVLWHETIQIARGLLPLFGVSLVLLFLVNYIEDVNHIVSFIFCALYLLVGMLWFKRWYQQSMYTRLGQAFFMLTHVVILAFLIQTHLDITHDGFIHLLTVMLIILMLMGLLMLANQHYDVDELTNKYFNVQAKPSVKNSYVLPQVLLDTAYGILPLAFIWLMVQNSRDAGIYLGLPYIPILNVLDISFMIIMLYALAIYKMAGNVVIAYECLEGEISQDESQINIGKQTINTNITNKHNQMKHATANKVSQASARFWYQPLLIVSLCIASFYTVSSMLVRTLHYYMDTPLWYVTKGQGAWQNDVVQTGLTILWVSIALILTLYASKRLLRTFWFAGITLLCLVVLKLIVVDLANSGAIMRIISFIVSGLVMLVIGYVAPLPPLVSDENNKPPN